MLDRFSFLMATGVPAGSRLHPSLALVTGAAAWTEASRLRAGHEGAAPQKRHPDGPHDRESRRFAERSRTPPGPWSLSSGATVPARRLRTTRFHVHSGERVAWWEISA